MEITSGGPDIHVGSGYNGGMFGNDGIVFLAFLAMMGGGFGFGNHGPNNIATTDTVNSAVQFSSLQDQNRDILNQISNSAMNTNNVVYDKYAELQRDIAANAVTLANVQAHQAECCCTIRQEIAAQTLRQQEQFGTLQLQTEQKFAALNEKLAASEIQRLRDEVQQLREQNFVQYPRGFTYNAGQSPFCNGGLQQQLIAAGF